jgi:putative oxidoreductase
VQIAIDSESGVFSMTSEKVSDMHVCKRGWKGYQRVANVLEHGIPMSIILLLSRIGVGGVFWRAGQTKVDGWQVTDSALFLFEEEYKVPLLPADIAAYMAAAAEHIFAVMLFVGLATRLGALGLLGMTLVIQVFVYPENYIDHTFWAAALILILSRGAGAISADAFLKRLVCKS